MSSHSSSSSSRSQHTYLHNTLEKKSKNKWDDDIQGGIKMPKKTDLFLRERLQHFNFRNTSPSQVYELRRTYEPMSTSPSQVYEPRPMSTSYQTRSKSRQPPHASVAVSPSFEPIQTPPHNLRSEPYSPSHDPYHSPSHDPYHSPSHDPSHSPSYQPQEELDQSLIRDPVQPQEELDPSLIRDLIQMSIYHDNLAKNHNQLSYPIEKVDEFVISLHYPYGFPIQKTSEHHGCCVTQTAPLVYMFLGNFLDTYSPKTPGLDFKLYASPPVKVSEKRIDNPDFSQKKTIEFWMNLIAKEDKTIFLKELAIIDKDVPILRRRCLTFSLEAADKSDPKFFGHRITLMIQRHGDGPIDLVIFDNLEADIYRVDVHKYILDAMLEYTKTQISKINGSRDICLSSIQINKYSVDTDTHLKYDTPFMTCISMSLRTCIYLSIIKDFSMIKETDLAYDLHLSHFTQQLRQMIHWIYNSMEYDLQQRIPIISLEMTKLVFPIQKSHCYLGFIDAVELPETLISHASDDTKIKYLLDHGDPRYYDYSNDEENTFVPRHSPIKNVCVTQSRFLY